jgi:glycosyltransferase involved in cell wall biosynthesis
LAAVRALGALPATRRAAAADVVFAQNEDTRARLPRTARDRAVVMNHAMFTEPPPLARCHPTRTCLFVGALERRKGAALAIRAVAAAGPAVSLRVVGDGPDRGRLERLAQRLGVAPRVQFEGRLPRAEVMHRLATAAAVVFTGLREEGGLALAEAMLAGAPVVVLANGGARTIALTATDPSRVALIEPADAATTVARLARAMADFTERPSTVSGPTLDVGRARAALHDAVEQVTRRRHLDRLSA